MKYMITADKYKKKKILSKNCINQVTTDIGTLKDEIVNFHKGITGFVIDENNKFISQQVFILYISSPVDYSRFTARAHRYNINPAMVYTPYGVRDKDGFYAVFIHDIEVTDKRAAVLIHRILAYIFDVKEADQKELSIGGKKLRSYSPNSKINILDLAISLQAYVEEIDYKNYTRIMNTLSVKLDLAWDGKIFEVCTGETMKYFEEKMLQYDKLIYVTDKISSTTYVIVPRAAIAPINSKERKRKRMKKSIEELKCSCFIYSKLLSGKASYDEKQFLASNIRYMEKWKDLFLPYVSEQKSFWKKKIQYLNLICASPMKCICPYGGQCNCSTLLEKMTQKIQQTGHPKEYVPIGKAEIQLKRMLFQCYGQKDEDIHLIKAQTSLGKTTAYIKLAKEAEMMDEKPLMIVVNTNKLKSQVTADLVKEGVLAEATPSVLGMLKDIKLKNLYEEVQELYSSGFGLYVKKTIRGYLKKHWNKLSDLQRECIKNYLDFKEKLQGKNCIVTTHEMFLVMDKETLKKYSVIIDEDILCTIFRKISSVSFEDIRESLDNGLVPKKFEYRVRNLLTMPDDSVGETFFEKMTVMDVEEIYKRKKVLPFSLPDFLKSSYYHIDRKKGIINYFNKIQLPTVKMIIMSATIDEKLYTAFCKGRNIHYYEVGQVKYLGKILQYTAQTGSRKNVSIVGKEKIDEAILRITGNPDIKKITFKANSTEEIYFGKVEGFNDYTGEDVAIIGTPHLPPFVYRLIGKCLGYADGSLARRTVERAGLKFPFMTFENDDMRNLQMFFISSELEQAVGRARLLRYRCTVYVFSNFPVQQAQIRQDDYLEIAA